MNVKEEKLWEYGKKLKKSLKFKCENKEVEVDVMYANGNQSLWRWREGKSVNL